MKQPARQRRCRECAHGGGADGLAEQGDASGVAAELGDIGLNPAQRSDQVEPAVVAGDALIGFRAELRVGQKAKAPKTIIDRDDNDAFAGQLFAIEDRLPAEPR